MAKRRVHEIAKDYGITSKEVLQAFKDAGVYVKAASSTVEDRDIRRAFPDPPPKPEPAAAKEPKKAAAPAAKEPPEETEAPAPQAETDADGKAKVPRAKATKRAKDA